MGLIYQRSLIAVAASISIIYLGEYWDEEGIRTLLSVLGIFTTAYVLSWLPFWLSEKLNPPKKPINVFHRDVLLRVKTTKWGPNGLETEDKLRVSDSYDGDCVNISISFNPRKVDRLEISPIRRPLADSKGVIEDAERLANEPLR